jgi:hypothetical protein
MEGKLEKNKIHWLKSKVKREARNCCNIASATNNGITGGDIKSVSQTLKISSKERISTNIQAHLKRECYSKTRT